MKCLVDENTKQSSIYGLVDNECDLEIGNYYKYKTDQFQSININNRRLSFIVDDELYFLVIKNNSYITCRKERDFSRYSIDRLI